MINDLNYNNTLFSKGLLLRTANAIRDAVYSSGDEFLIAQYEELGRLRQRITNLQSKEDADQDYIESLETQAEELDKSLSRDSAVYRDFQADSTMTWQTVQAALHEDEAAIEFVSFQLYDKKWTDTTLYAALLLRPGMEAPAWVPLCNESQIKEQLERVQGQNQVAAVQARILYTLFGPQLYALIWQPLEAELQGVRKIYYSPSGLLHKVSFAALPVDGNRLVDKYDLNLVSSTRELVKRTGEAPGNPAGGSAGRPEQAVVYGGLKYGEDKEEDRAEMTQAARNYREQAALAAQTRREQVAERDRRDSVTAPPANPILISQLSAGQLPPEESTRGGEWKDLPASREESRLIFGYLKNGGIRNSLLYQDTAGNEESFKGLDREGTNIIHLATHGYFLEDIEKEGREEDRALVQRLGGGRRGGEKNPLLQSGLILAGGNHAWIKKPVEGEGIEDGILTAAEIADMNLLGAELVVLSACQTGLGEVKNGEGVFGLQRAFKLAGVETLIMSLWEVADEATSKLMGEFYRRWLGGEGKQEAFKGAQGAVRKLYPEPYYWAAFVMMD
jgi:CHAT domain-containing protein